MHVAPKTKYKVENRRRSTVLELAFEAIESSFKKHYSITKLRDFQKYHDTASLMDILRTCLALILVPILVLSVIIVGMPVESIQSGLTGDNWNQIGQLAIGGLAAGQMINIRYRKVVRKSQMTTWHHAIAIGIVPVTLCIPTMIVDTSWVYPVPFVMVCGGGLGAFACLCCYLWFKRKNWSLVKADVQAVVMSVLLSYSTIVWHEIVGVLYRNQSEDPLKQAAVGLTLPFLRIGLQRCTRKIFEDKVEGLAGALSIFEVKFFNSLYTSIFTQQTVNIFVRFSLLSWDLIENIYFLYTLNSLGR